MCALSMPSLANIGLVLGIVGGVDVGRLFNFTLEGMHNEKATGGVGRSIYFDFVLGGVEITVEGVKLPHGGLVSDCMFVSTEHNTFFRELFLLLVLL